MIGLIKLIVFGFLGLSVIYLTMRIYAASTERERLERIFDAGGIEGDRDSFVRAGMKDYHSSLRHKLLILICIIPTIAIFLTAYLVNHQ